MKYLGANTDETEKQLLYSVFPSAPDAMGEGEAAGSND